MEENVTVNSMEFVEELEYCNYFGLTDIIINQPKIEEMETE